MPAPLALILDLDGTLVDTNAAHAESWEQAFLKYGYTVPRAAVEDAIGKGGEVLVAAVAGEDAERRHGDALRDAAGEIFASLAEAQSFALFPGTLALLAEARRRGLRTAIATSATRGDLKAILDSAGEDLTERVDAVTTASDVDEPKPDPDVVRAALEKLGVAPREARFVGDTAWDAVACRRAGVPFLGVSTWVHDAERLRGEGALRVYPHVGALQEDLDGALSA